MLRWIRGSRLRIPRLVRRPGRHILGPLRRAGLLPRRVREPGLLVRRVRQSRLLVLGLVGVFLALPTSFLPVEDQGRAQLQYTLPPGATETRTLAVVKEIEQYFLNDEKENVPIIFAIVGQSQAGAGQNAGRGFVALAVIDTAELFDQAGVNSGIDLGDCRIGFGDVSGLGAGGRGQPEAK